MSDVKERVTHTPGPWQVIPGDTIRRPLLVRDLTGFTIAEAHWNEHMEGEAEDNARLIAAAPDLLDALRGMVGLVQLIQRREPELQTNHRFVDALAAIAKAEGR